MKYGRDMIGRTISHYNILEKLGAGGMGVVYKAQDTKLERIVALKFLPQHLSQSEEEKRRFIHEAKAASALDHNNICTIHEIDETEPAPGEPGGQLFIAMAYYEGETLEQMISPVGAYHYTPLPIDRALDIALQISEGLAKAHGKEIVHRDLKPANVMVTQDGVVKILDFGLAKLRGQTKLTKEGTTLGTVAYMSPEQTVGEEVDHRTDIFSLGVLLYEMVTGQQPFRGDYEQAVTYSIVNEEPEPITSLRTGVRMELERIVNKCLQKEASARYQGVNELLVDLKAVQGAQSQAKSVWTGLKPAPISKTTTLPKVSNFRKVLAVGGFAVVAAATIVGYLLFDPEAKSTERIAIAVVDFVNQTNEPELDGLSGMLITALEQSRHLSVLTRSRMFDILKQIDQQDVDRIDEARGRDICQQANVNAMVIASIRKFGRLYAIDLKILDPQKNEYIFTANEKSEGQESIPSMIDKLSEKTRRGLKEEAAKIQVASQKVAAVTTVSLEAYQHYFLGEQLVNRFRFEEAEEEFKKAISLDTTFALAYYRLAYAIAWRDLEGPKEPTRKAMQYLDRAPEKEKYFIRAWNARVINGNFDEATALCHELLKLYPEEKEALYRIGDYSYHKGDYPDAVRYLERALAIDPTFELALQHIIWTYRDVGQHDEVLENASQYVAKTPTSEEAYDLLGDAYSLRADFDNALRTHRRALELFPTSTRPIMRIGFIHLFENEFAKAEAEFNKLLQAPRSLADQRDGYISLSVLHAYLGRYRDAIKLLDKIIEIDLKFSDETGLARRYVERAFWLLVGWNDVENAKKAIEKGLESENAADLTFYSYLCLSYLMTGEYDKALAVACSKLVHIPFRDVFVRAYVHRARGDYEKAIKDFQMVTQRGHVHDKVSSGYNLALCYFETRQNEKAIEAVRRMQRIYWSGTRLVVSFRAELYPKSFYLLGKIYEQKGDISLAIETYKKFLDLWKNADEDLVDLIDAKERLAKLRGQ